MIDLHIGYQVQFVKTASGAALPSSRRTSPIFWPTTVREGKKALTSTS